MDINWNDIWQAWADVQLEVLITTGALAILFFFGVLIIPFAMWLTHRGKPKQSTVPAPHEPEAVPLEDEPAELFREPMTTEMWKQRRRIQAKKPSPQPAPVEPQSIDKAPSQWWQWWGNFWQGISTEFFGAVVTTIFLGIVILVTQQYQSIQNRKAELILQMGSPDNATAVEAARQLNTLGWIKDGTLSNVDLWGANLAGANLEGANLTNTNLRTANLTNANLAGADLTNADLMGADLTNADLRDANLMSAFVQVADLTGTSLWNANLTHVVLSRADLAGANLEGANLTHAFLWEADLTGANLRGAKLTDAFLMGADFTNAYLRSANLTNADLTYVDLTNADLWEARLPNGLEWTPVTNMARFTDNPATAFSIPDWLAGRTRR